MSNVAAQRWRSNRLRYQHSHPACILHPACVIGARLPAARSQLACYVTPAPLVCHHTRSITRDALTVCTHVCVTSTMCVTMPACCLSTTTGCSPGCVTFIFLLDTHQATDPSGVGHPCKGWTSPTYNKNSYFSRFLVAKPPPALAGYVVQYPCPRWTTHLDSDIGLHICVASYVCVWLLGYLQYFLLKNDWNILFVIGVWFLGDFFWCLLFWCYLLVYIYCMLIFLVLLFCVGLLLVWLFFYFCVKVISLFVVLGRYFLQFICS